MPDITTCSNRNGSQIYGPSLTWVAFLPLSRSLWIEFNVWILFRKHKHKHTLGMCPVCLECNAIYSSASYNTNTFQMISFCRPFSSSSPHRSGEHGICFDTNFLSYKIQNYTAHYIIRIRWGRVMENISDVEKVFVCFRTCLELNCALVV